uniref:Saposin B-type domain-containing protein n=1 Tax=Trichobilharzia regenti TaxID=157069 RepID=A0AA85JVS8_TRIRE|nr:unnamed protein product [Trichobilharzia regenti]
MFVANKRKIILFMALLIIFQVDSLTFSQCTKKLQFLFRRCYITTLIAKSCSNFDQGAMSSFYNDIVKLGKMCNDCGGCVDSFMSCSLEALKRMNTNNVLRLAHMLIIFVERC